MSNNTTEFTEKTLADKILDFSQQELSIKDRDVATAVVLLSCFMLATPSLLEALAGKTPIVAADGGVLGYVAQNASSLDDFIKTPNGQEIVKNVINANGLGNWFEAQFNVLQNLSYLKTMIEALSVLIPAPLLLKFMTENAKDRKVRISTHVLPFIAHVLHAHNSSKTQNA